MFYIVRWRRNPSVCNHVIARVLELTIWSFKGFVQLRGGNLMIKIISNAVKVINKALGGSNQTPCFQMSYVSEHSLLGQKLHESNI